MTNRKPTYCSRSHPMVRTAPGSARQETVGTPSTSSSTPPTIRTNRYRAGEFSGSARLLQMTLLTDAVGLDQPGGELVVNLLGRIQPERMQDI